MDSLTEADVLRSLGALHAKVDILLEERHTNASRIAYIEKWLWTVTGAFVLVSTFFLPNLKALVGLL